VITATPPCFDSDEQYEAWMALTVSAPVQPRQVLYVDIPNFCQDCTVCYKAQMILENRCVFKATQFAIVSEAPAGKLPTNREVVGYQGSVPACADFSPAVARKMRAAAAVSGPSASRTPRLQSGSSPPTPESPAQSTSPSAAGEPQYKETSGPLGAGQGTGYGRSQS
jgi:hypothetical protein